MSKIYRVAKHRDMYDEIRRLVYDKSWQQRRSAVEACVFEVIFHDRSCPAAFDIEIDWPMEVVDFSLTAAASVRLAAAGVSLDQYREMARGELTGVDVAVGIRSLTKLIRSYNARHNLGNHELIVTDVSRPGTFSPMLYYVIVVIGH
jgi:hypothetical protein